MKKGLSVIMILLVTLSVLAGYGAEIEKGNLQYCHNINRRNLLSNRCGNGATLDRTLPR